MTKAHLESTQRNLELQELLAAKQIELLDLKIAQERIILQRLQEDKTRPDNGLPVIENPVNEVNRKKK